MKSQSLSNDGAVTARQRARNRLADLTFLVQLLRAPKHTGAIAPSGKALARAIAAEVDPAIPGIVVELGPGTGRITEALIERGIDRDRLVLIELNGDFRRHLSRRFPGIRIIDGDAFKVAEIVAQHGFGDVSAVVSGLPLLHWPGAERQRLVRQALALMPAGNPFVQFTYASESSVAPDPESYTSHRSRRIWRNLPPATVWTYRCARSRPLDVAA